MQFGVGRFIERFDMSRLTRWGNSTGVRLPVYLMESAGLKPGDFVSMRLLDSGDVLLRPVQRKISAIPATPESIPMAPLKDPDAW